jgi:hypothetical protein
MFKLRDHIECFSSKKDKQMDIQTKVYLCGTLWHETKGEMIQILKSIMR